MGKGGARAKSGPAKDPQSARSEQTGYVLTALPAEGYKKRPPGLIQFIPKPTVRQRAVWERLWKTPQACAWSRDPWRWDQVATLTRLRCRAEDADAPAAIFGELAKLETRLGLSEEGLRFLGWQIKHDELAPRRPAAKKAAAVKPAPVRRLRG